MSQRRSVVVAVGVLVGCCWGATARAQAGDPPAPPTSQAPAALPYGSGNDPVSLGAAGRPHPKEDSDEGLFGPVRIGAIGGVGLPRPLSLEGMIKLDKIAAVGVEYSVFPKFTISGVETKFWALAVDARVFPLETGFFIGMAVGHQHLGATTALTLPAPLGGTIPEAVEADTWFINPRIGFLSTWGSGITAGIDAGVQIPVSGNFSSTLPQGYSVSNDVNDVAHFFAKTSLPTINLLRLGVLL